MGDRRCCCGGGARACIVCQDSFDRADSDNILPFIEKQEQCSISSNRLKVEASGLAYCPTRHPIVTWTAVAHVWLVNMAVGNEYVLFVNYDPVEGDYEGIKFVCDDATYGTLSLYGFGSASQSLIPYGPPIGDNELLISICRNENAIWGENSATDTYIYDVLDRSEYEEKRRYAGVMNPGSNDVYFNDFRFEEHHKTNRLCDCCPCPCGADIGGGHCPDYDEPHTSLPRSLLATFAVYGTDCPQWFIDAVDGLECSLEIQTTGHDYIIWVGEVEGPNEDNSGTETYDLYLYCHNAEEIAGQFELVGVSPTIFGPQSGDLPEGGNGAPPIEDGSNCVETALSIRFGPWGGPGDDCWFDIIVTEAP